MYFKKISHLMSFKNISLFKDLEHGLLEKISHGASLKKCSAKTIIFDEGSVTDTDPFILKSGIVIISKTNYVGY